jgi:CBS domain-containing protein
MKINAPISEILRHKSSQVWTISASATVFDAISLLAGKNVGALPVVEDERVIGIISERDYTRKVALQGRSSRDTRVREIMVSSVITIAADSTIDACMQLVTRHRVRHLPVVSDGRLAGMISIGDLVNWTISAQSAALDQMENYIMGGYAG